MTILLTQDQQQTVKATHEYIQAPGGNFYHQPFWLRDCGDGRFESVRYENLPDSVKDFILQTRGIK